jgi:amino-acid N-acetyltransferase
MALTKARLVDAAKISKHLDAGEIVLLSALAYSPSGETFNVRTEEIAARMTTERDRIYLPRK